MSFPTRSPIAALSFVCGMLPMRGVAPFLVLIAAFALPVPDTRSGGILGIPTLCPFRRLTGLPCPGCGMTRAIVCAAHGHWRDSLHYHPLGIAILILLAAWTLAPWLPPRWTPPQKIVHWGAAGLIVALLAVWIVRLAHGLPWPP